MKIRIKNTSRGRAMRPIEAVIFGLVFTLCGLALLFYSFQTIKDYKEKDAKYIEVSAEVVDYRENSEGLLAIIAEYEVDGEKYTKTGSTYSNSPKSIGSTVAVKYNPKNPKDAIWKNDSTNLVLPLVSTGFTLVGLLIFITGILGFKDKNKKDSSDEVNKAINDFETSQNENNMVDNTLGAVAAPVISALNNAANVSVSNETTQVSEDNKVGELEQSATVSKSETEGVVPSVEQNVVVENTTTNDVPVEIVPSVESIQEETVKSVTVNETVVENVVQTVEQNVVSENGNNEMQVEKPVEAAPVVEAQPVVENITNVEPLNESIPQPVVTSESVVENVVPSVEPIKEETVNPVNVNETIVENVFPTVEQNVVSENGNNEMQVEKQVEVTPVVDSQPVVETITNVEPLNESIPQPVVTSEPVVENVVPTVEQNVVSENNNNEIQVEKSIEITPVVEDQPVVENIPTVEPLNESIPQPVVTSEPVVENAVPTVEQNIVVENTTTNEVPVEIVPTVEPIKEETVKPVTVNEPVVENVVPTVEQNVQQSVNNNM